MIFAQILKCTLGTALLTSSVVLLTACGGGSSSTGAAALKFTQAEFENAVLVNEDVFASNPDYDIVGGILKFGAGTAQYYSMVSAGVARESLAAWEVLVNGELQVTIDTTTCLFKKVKESTASIEVAGTCDNDTMGAAKWLKPQAISVSDLTGRTIVISGPEEDNPAVLEERVRLSFKDDGTVTAVSEDDGEQSTRSLLYSIAADKSITVETGRADDGGVTQEVMYLMEGTLSSGKILGLGIGYEGEGKLDTMSTTMTNGDKWTESGQYSVPSGNNTK